MISSPDFSSLHLEATSYVLAYLLVFSEVFLVLTLLAEEIAHVLNPRQHGFPGCWCFCGLSLVPLRDLSFSVPFLFPPYLSCCSVSTVFSGEVLGHGGVDSNDL